MNLETIETRNLLLKALSPSDINYIFEHYTKPGIKEILGHRSEEDYQKEETKYRNGYSSYNRSFKLFLLIDKISKSIIGRCGLHNWNAEHKRAEIGYVMEDEVFKRKGLMTEALEAVIDYGFNQMNLHRIEALVGSNNIPSLRLMEKYNFIKEGIAREHYYIAGKYENSVLFSKLHSEYERENNRTTQLGA